MKEVILLVLTLCSFFIYSCDGGSGGSGPLVSGQIVTKPDPNNVRSLYGTYELTDMEEWIEGAIFSCNSPNLTGRLVFNGYDTYYSFDCVIPSIGVIYDDVESWFEIGNESWETKAELEGENVKFTTGELHVVKGKKISDSTIVNYNLTPFTRTKTPLSADNYSTLTGTYIVNSGKARIETIKQSQPVSLVCTLSFAPQATLIVASLESTTRSAFFGLSFECADEQTGKKEENRLFGYGQTYDYKDGFVQGNWAGGGEPIIKDEENIILPILGDRSGKIEGELMLRKIHDAINIISKSDM